MQLVGASTSRSMRLPPLLQRSKPKSKLAHTDMTRSNQPQRNPRRSAAMPKNINTIKPSSRDAVTSTDTPADAQPPLSSDDSENSDSSCAKLKMTTDANYFRYFLKKISPPILFVWSRPEGVARIQVNIPPPVTDLINALDISGGAERTREIESECRRRVLFRQLRKVSANGYTSNYYFL